jgi:hypothetical protein
VTQDAPTSPALAAESSAASNDLNAVLHKLVRLAK